ncbi:MAG TPA: T9SS type A sorting domain-containing protein, partial [Puia sp.]
VKIYPNPTTGLVYLEDAAKLRMSLFNGSGQQMNVPVVEDGSSVVLNLGRLPEGTYFLQLWDNGRAVLKTIIKE